MKSRVINPAEAKCVEKHLANDKDGMIKLLCQVMRVAGLRVSDACNLKFSDIDGNILCVVEQKTGKSKQVVLPVQLVNAIAKRQKAHPDETYVFVSAYNRKCGKDKPVSRRYVLDSIKKAAKDAGIKGQVSPHSFRKCAGTEVYKRTGNDIVAAQKFLNHSSPVVTMVYLAVNQEAIDNVTAHMEL